MSAAVKLNTQMVDLLSTVFERCWATDVSTWDPPPMNDGAVTSTTVTVDGARLGDPALASLSTIGPNDVMISAHVESVAVGPPLVGTVRVILYNRTGAIFNIGSGTLTVAVRVR